MADNQAKREIRRRRIAEALRTAVDGEPIQLDELAKVWGVGKPAFVNIRDNIPGFPAAVIDGKKYLYPRVVALKVLEAWERRGDAANAAKSSRIAALIGMDHPPDSPLTISELQKANSLRIDLEDRLRQQRALVSMTEFSQLTGKMMEIISRGLANLGTAVDPNGQYPAEVAAAADTAGQEILLRLHALMKDTLTQDASLRATGSDRDGGDARRARPARSPRKRQ